MNIDVTTHDRDTAAVAANRLAALLIARVRALNLANRGAEPELSSRIDEIQSDLTAERHEYGILAATAPRSPEQEARLLELKQEINSSQSRLTTLQDSLDAIRVAREERANSLVRRRARGISVDAVEPTFLAELRDCPIRRLGWRNRYRLPRRARSSPAAWRAGRGSGRGSADPRNRAECTGR